MTTPRPARMIATAIAAVLCISCTTAASGTNLHTLETNPEAAISVLSRIYRFRQSGPGALCTRWRRCRRHLRCVLWYGKAGGFGLGVCKRVIRVGHGCGGSLTVCHGHSKCTVARGSRRCRVKLGVSRRCTDHRRFMCSYGLRCVRGYCYRAGGYGSPCGGKFQTCRRGFICAKKKGRHVCKVLVKKGRKCGYANAACYPGFKCLKYRHLGHRCIRLMGRNKSCAGHFMGCRRGLVCVGRRPNRRCVGGGGKGYVCGTAHRFCRRGLKCIRYGAHGKRHCVRVMRKGGNCSGSFMGCYRGLRCVGPSKRRRCMPALGKGTVCSKGRFSYKYCAAVSCATSTGAGSMDASGAAPRLVKGVRAMDPTTTVPRDFAAFERANAPMLQSDG
eukprot:IDg35t1